MRRAPLDITTTGALSIFVHVAVAFVIVAARFVGRDAPDGAAVPPPSTRDTAGVVIEVPEVLEIDASPLQDRLDDAVSTSAPRGGKDPRPDMDRAGKGGEEVSEAAQNFADRDDGISRDKSLLSREDRAQVARLRASDERRSYEDRRAVREPDFELTFFAVAKGGIHPEERRKEADVDPGSGVLVSAPRDRVGMQRGEVPDPDGVRIEDIGASPKGARTPERVREVGGTRTSPGVGRARASGARESQRARTENARPQVEADDPSVFANAEGRPTDDIDLEQEIQARQMAILQSSTSGGKAGAGKGGTAVGGAPGAGGTRGAGTEATPNGSGGNGPPDPFESARLGYVRALLAQIYPHTERVFPRRAALEGRSGAVTVTMVIEADGSLSSARVVVASGIGEFDENVRAAVVRAGPFGKLPAALGARFTFPLRFSSPNPAVRPESAGDGPRM